MADTQPYRPRKRGYESAKDMMWSLLPIVVAVLAFVAFCGPRDSSTTVVDPSADIRSTAQVVGYPLVAPNDLADEWRSTASTVLRSEDGEIIGLSIGYLSPDGETARFVVSSGTRDAVLATALGNGDVVSDPDGETQNLGELSWVPVKTTAGQALVAAGDGFVAVVAGSASYGELYELAGAVATFAP